MQALTSTNVWRELGKTRDLLPWSPRFSRAARDPKIDAEDLKVSDFRGTIAPRSAVSALCCQIGNQAA